MPATDTLELELQDLIWLNANFDNIGDATGIVASTGAGNMEFSLHTAALNDASNQNTSETTYTNYARVTVARSGAQFTNTAGVITNDNAIQFPTCGVTGATITDVGVGSDVVANELWFYGVLDSNLAVSNGITPQFAASAFDQTLT